MGTLQDALAKKGLVDPDVARFQADKKLREERRAEKFGPPIPKESKPKATFEVTIRIKTFIAAENADQIRALAAAEILKLSKVPVAVAVNPVPMKDKAAELTLNEGTLVP